MYLYRHIYQGCICLHICNLEMYIRIRLVWEPKWKALFLGAFLGADLLTRWLCHEETYAAKQKQMKAMQSELHTYQSQACGVAMRSDAWLGGGTRNRKTLRGGANSCGGFTDFLLMWNHVKSPNIVSHVKPPIMWCFFYIPAMISSSNGRLVGWWTRFPPGSPGWNGMDPFEVSDYKDEIDRLNRELQEVKKKFYDQKKREMIQQERLVREVRADSGVREFHQIGTGR